MTTKPNILLITSDQQHYSTLGTVNDRISTPNLDRLCHEGTRFDRAYCPNPTCTPTRASIITGLMPSQHGAWTLGTKLPEDVPTVGHYLAQAGYYSTLIGKAHFQPTASTDEYPSIECWPIVKDIDFWREFHGPWYGFDHIDIMRNHGDQWSAGQHYAVWAEEKGFHQWRDYYQEEKGQINQEKRDHYYDAERRCWSIPAEYHYNAFISERTIEHIEKAADKNQPFFCWASFPDPHNPQIVPEPWADMYKPEDMQPGTLHPEEHTHNPPHFAMTQQEDGDVKMRRLFADDGFVHGGHRHIVDEQEVRKDMAAYYAMVSFMDHHIGRILDTLDRLKLSQNTLVIFTTDHGDFFGQHGIHHKAIHHYEDLLRIPFISRWPGKIEPRAVSDDLQNLIDLTPTFLAAAGIEKPFHMTGKNALPNWQGAEPHRQCSITENHHGYRNAFMHTYVDKRYKLTVYRMWDEGELFDLQEDPDEIHNRWHDPHYAELKTELLLKFHQARMDTEQMRMPRISGA